MLRAISMGRAMPLFAAATVASLLLTLAATQAATAAGYHLQAERKAGDTAHVQALLEVTGNLSLSEKGQVRKLKMSVRGCMSYTEQLLEAASESANFTVCVRHYDRADAKIQIENELSEPQLRQERDIVGVVADGEETLLYSPLGPLDRDELDLIDLPAGSHVVERLLPLGPVELNARWSHDKSVAGLLLGLDAVSDSDLSSQLLRANAKDAEVELRGLVQGAVGGVATELDVKGTYRFNFESKRITWVALLVKEKRSIGHVAPGLEVSARLQMRVVPGAEVPEAVKGDLAAAAGAISSAPGAEQLFLAAAPQGGGVQLLHDRRWYVMHVEPAAFSMRMVDRGELVAQCNVKLLDNVAEDVEVTLQKFQDDIRSSLGDKFKQFISAQVSEKSKDCGVYRVVAAGQVDDLPIQWIYYRIANQKRQQAVMVFTMEGSLIERFGKADEELAATIALTEKAIDTAHQPTPAAAPQAAKPASVR